MVENDDTDNDDRVHPTQGEALITLPVGGNPADGFGRRILFTF